jgi:RNA polymerase sigma-70 factor (ECF subfamily)
MTFGEIYEEHAPAVYRCLLAWTRDALLAEELTSETFYRAIVSDQEVRAATARGYLIAIARNVWRKQMARRGRQGEMPADVSAPLALPAEARLDLERTLTALGELPDELREPLVLYAQGGLSYEEIAAQLEITLAAVKIRIFRARQKLESYR